MSAAPSWLLWVSAGLVLAAVSLLAWALLGRRQSRQERVGHLVSDYSVSGARPQTRTRRLDKDEAVTRVQQVAVGLAGRALHNEDRRAGLSLRLERAGLPVRPEEWLIIVVAVGLAAAAVFGLLGGLIAGLIGLASGLMVPHVWLGAKGTRRLAAFSDAVPDVLDLMASSLGAGYSLPQAVDAAATNAPKVVAAELSRAMAETKLGGDIEDGLAEVAERMDSEDFRWTVMAIRIQRTVGGNLAEVLRTTAHTIRERAQVRRKVRALSAEGKMSAYLLIALPPGFALVISVLNPGYLSPLLESFVGMVMIAAGVVGMIAGWFWMQALIRRVQL